MMTDTTEMNGALYVVPGSHKRGRIEPYYDENTSYKFWAVPKQRMIAILKSSPAPVADHRPRRHLRAVPLQPAARLGPQSLGRRPLAHLHLVQHRAPTSRSSARNPRPDWVVSRNWNPLPIEDDEGVLKAA